MLLGSFVFGVRGGIRGLQVEDLERRALRGGYAGGIVGIGLVVVDTTIRYAF